MSRPIKDTPILTGADARRFERAMRQNETRQVSDAEYQRAMAAYKKIKRLC